MLSLRLYTLVHAPSAKIGSPSTERYLTRMPHDSAFTKRHYMSCLFFPLTQAHANAKGMQSTARLLLPAVLCLLLLLSTLCGTRRRRKVTKQLAL